MARWRGCEVTVRATVVPRYCWTTASLDVYVDGDCVLRTGGVLRLSGHNEEVFGRDGTEHVAALSWRASRAALAYELTIDREPVETGQAVPGNLLLAYIPLAVGIGLAFLFAVFVLLP